MPYPNRLPHCHTGFALKTISPNRDRETEIGDQELEAGCRRCLMPSPGPVSFFVSTHLSLVAYSPIAILYPCSLFLLY